MKKKKTVVFEPHLDAKFYARVEAYRVEQGISSTKQALIALANKGLGKWYLKHKNLYERKLRIHHFTGGYLKCLFTGFYVFLFIEPKNYNRLFK